MIGRLLLYFLSRVSTETCVCKLGFFRSFLFTWFRFFLTPTLTFPKQRRTLSRTCTVQVLLEKSGIEDCHESVQNLRLITSASFCASDGTIGVLIFSTTIQAGTIYPRVLIGTETYLEQWKHAKLVEYQSLFQIHECIPDTRIKLCFQRTFTSVCRVQHLLLRTFFYLLLVCEK